MTSHLLGYCKSFGRFFGVAAVVVLIADCGGAGTEASTTDDSSDENQSDTPSPAFSRVACGASALTVEADAYRPEDYYGLSCVHWKKEASGDLRVDFWQQYLECEEIAAASVFTHNASNITFRLLMNLADCICCYNFNLTVPAETVDLSGDLNFCVDIKDNYDVDSDDISEWQTGSSSLCEAPETLFTSTADEGIVCRYAADRADAIEQCNGRDDGLFGNCSPDASDTESMHCPDGLTCEEVADNGMHNCLKHCEEDTDCPLDILSCQDNLCKLR